ncbi:MAG: hypothetical protein JNL70_07960 [Saprospiraceae bacterium]|nr:hypothetical protein [Saprospiraceae bacterium]
MTNKAKFDAFAQKFPEIELPVTIRDDSNHDFEQNSPLSDAMIADFISRYEPTVMDDFTEYMACFSLPKAPKQEYQALVYWKAALMQYDYVLATYSLDGNMIDKKAVAGTKVKGDAVQHILATIDEKLAIFVAEGAATEGEDYDPNSTKTHRFEILPNGRIEQDY